MTPFTREQNFYEQIPAIRSLEEIMQSEHFCDVPEDWYIGLSDVRGSTKAIKAGKYKQVNAIAAAGITALLNEVPDTDLPFVFGGDGATILLPPEIYDKAQIALKATRQRAAAAFELDLRVGIVPVSEVYRAGKKIRVARLHMSENFQQAIFTGGGLQYAESLLKDPVKGEAFRLPEDGETHEADFSGFECRWQKIPSRHGETLSLMVQAMGDEAGNLYQEILRKIDSIYGDRGSRHPLTVDNLRMSLLPGHFKTEAAIREGDYTFKQLLELAWLTFKGRIAIAFDIQGWGRYKSLLVEATDNEKFDDCLRMTISGSEAQRQELGNYLERLRQEGRLVYGIHTSGHTLVTCIVFDHFGRQVHFVDGDDGGYAMAATQFKMQSIEIPAIKLSDMA